MKVHLRNVFQAGCVVLMVVLAFGCTNQQQTVTVEGMLHDMSPGFETVALSHRQRLIRQARAMDLNSRQLVDDIDKLLLVYRPRRLTIFPVP